MINLTRASFQYENSDRGVQDISLSVKRGECVVLTGLSGCGKTTVTRLVNGLAPSYYCLLYTSDAADEPYNV